MDNVFFAAVRDTRKGLQIAPHTVSYYRRDAKQKLLDTWGATYGKKMGWRIAKVRTELYEGAR